MGMAASAPAGKEWCGVVTYSKLAYEMVKGTHIFEIKGYSLVKGFVGHGKYVSSNVFSVGGHDWAVYLYPHGLSSTTCVSVYVVLVSKAKDVKAQLSLALLDQSGKGNHIVPGRYKIGTFSKPGNSKWGYRSFIAKNDLENSDFVKDDCLAILVTVRVFKYGLSTSRYRKMLPKIPVPPSEFSSNFKCLFESEISYDIAFVVGDKTFKAHKVILAFRSPVFKAQFFGPMGDANLREIVVEDIAPSIFKGMLHYIYTDTLPDVSDIIEDPSLCTSNVMIQHLLVAADRYDINRLKLLCESKLAEEINHNTWATTIALAEQHHCIPLKDACLAFVASIDNLNAVVQTEGFKQLENYPSLLSDILKKCGDKNKVA